MWRKLINIRLIGFVILAYLLLKISRSGTLKILVDCDLVLVGAAWLLMFVSTFMKFLRYQYILIQQGVRMPLLRTIRFCLAANYLSYVTPGRIGEFSKVYFLAKASQAPANRLAAGALMDRLFDVYTLLLIAGVLGWATVSAGGIGLAGLGWLILAIAVAPLVLIIPAVRRTVIFLSGLLQKWFRGKKSWAEQVRLFFQEIDSLLCWRMIWCLAATVAAYAAFFLCCYLLSRSVDVALPFFKITLFVAIASMLSFLPISVAGIGTREASLVYFFAAEGLASESALAFSSLIFVSTYLLFGLIGFVAFMGLRYNQ